MVQLQQCLGEVDIIGTVDLLFRNKWRGSLSSPAGSSRTNDGICSHHFLSYLPSLSQIHGAPHRLWRSFTDHGFGTQSGTGINDELYFFRTISGKALMATTGVRPYFTAVLDMLLQVLETFCTLLQAGGVVLFFLCSAMVTKGTDGGYDHDGIGTETWRRIRT